MKMGLTIEVAPLTNKMTFFTCKFLSFIAWVWQTFPKSQWVVVDTYDHYIDAHVVVFKL
jgi:hypothetical protein